MSNEKKQVDKMFDRLLRNTQRANPRRESISEPEKVMADFESNKSAVVVKTPTVRGLKWDGKLYQIGDKLRPAKEDRERALLLVDSGLLQSQDSFERSGRYSRLKEVRQGAQKKYSELKNHRRDLKAAEQAKRNAEIRAEAMGSEIKRLEGQIDKFEAEVEQQLEAVETLEK